MAEMAETPEKATPEQLGLMRSQSRLRLTLRTPNMTGSMACLMTKTKTTPKTTSRR